MTPKEKAQELIEKFKSLVIFKLSDGTIFRLQCQKQCALIAVEEILESLLPEFKKGSYKEKYWQQVKTEIQNK